MMEQLQSFDDKIINLILQYSLLHLSSPERITADEVYAAAELALQISTRDGAGTPTRRPATGATVSRPALNEPARNPATRNPPSREARTPAGRQAMATQSGVINADERREILLDSDDSDTETETRGEPCIACAGGSGEKRRLSCGCTYCAPCLRRCIRSGLRNEESWPPRCHGRLTEDDIRWARRPGLLRLWRQMATEWDSPASGRLYCSRPACAAFIPGAGGGQAGEVRCGACGEGTCGGCRRPWHLGLPCDEEEEEEELMDMMDQYGYASCNNCRRIVDLRDGCNHISCGCGHQFCYLCGDTWKTCLCPRHGTTTGRRPARQRAQRYRQSHDEIPFVPQAPDPDLLVGDPQALGFFPDPQEVGVGVGRGGDVGGHAPPGAEWFPGGVVREQDLDWLVPPPRDWVPGVERRQDLEGVPPPADWIPPQPPAGAAAGNSNANANRNDNNELVFIDDGTQPRDPGRTYVYDWEVTPGRQPWVRRYPPGHPGDRRPDATVQTRFMAEGERVHPAVMPRGDGGGDMVFLPQVDSSDEYGSDFDSEEEEEEDRRRRERRERRQRRWRNQQEPPQTPEPRRAAEPRRTQEPPHQALEPLRAAERPRAPGPQVRYDITYARDGRPRIREAPCAHHLPAQWAPSGAANPPCPHCRGAHRNRELWRCVGCHVQACRRHMARYGLGRREAERGVQEIERRTRGTGFGFASFFGVGGRL